MSSESKALDALRSKSIDELTKEAIAFLSSFFQNYQQLPWSATRAFWLQLGIDPIKVVEPKLQFAMEVVNARVAEWMRQQDANRRAKETQSELQSVDKLVPELLERAQLDEVRKLDVGFTELFLAEKNVELSLKGKRILRAKANLELAAID